MKEIDTFDQEQKPKNERLKMSAIQELPSQQEQGSEGDKVYTVQGTLHESYISQKNTCESIFAPFFHSFSHTWRGAGNKKSSRHRTKGTEVEDNG